MSFAQKSFRHIPLWSQLAVGLVVVLFIVIANRYAPIYVSEWYEEDSNFFENGSTVLAQKGFSPSAPTLLFFWDKSCDTCEAILSAFKRNNHGLRLIGVHTEASAQDEVEIRQKWTNWAPRPARSVIDEQKMLESTFEVIGTPTSILILPNKKKMYRLIGEIEGRNPSIEELTRR